MQAIAAKPKEKVKEKTREELQAEEMAAFKLQTRNQVGMLAIGGVDAFGRALRTGKLYAALYCLCSLSLLAS